MNYFFLDASALGKRYVPEQGSQLLHYLFEQLDRSRLRCLTIGALEAISVVIRAQNGGRITSTDAADALAAVRAEVFASMPMVSARDDLVFFAATLIEKHHINSTDAILLRAALDLMAGFRANGDDLVLISSDRRLLRAADREGLPALDPEDEDIGALQALADR